MEVRSTLRLLASLLLMLLAWSGVSLADPLLGSSLPSVTPPGRDLDGGSSASSSRTIIVLKEAGVAEAALRAAGPRGLKGTRQLSSRVRKVASAQAASVRASHGRITTALRARKVPVRRLLAVALNGVVVDQKLSFEEAAQILPGEVLAVYEDRSVQASLEQSVPSTKAPLVWVQATTGAVNITGRGIRIGIIDTGIDYTHADLGGCARTSDISNGSCSKVVGGYDFVNGDRDPFDDQGHGTHCAATAAGNGALRGVAPDALLFAYKVLGANGGGYMSDVIAGIERSVDPNGDGLFDDRLDVISLSLGSDGGSPDDLDAQAIDRAVSLGVVAVVAAGNSGPGAKTVGSPGVARRALTVGASDNGGTVAYFSSRGPVNFTSAGTDYTLLKPDIVAPGVSICAALATGSRRLGALCGDSTHQRISGTSMATPHVAGVAALVRQAHPTWTADEVRAAIKRGAERLSTLSNERLSSVGVGFVDAAAAVAESPAAVAIEELQDGSQLSTVLLRVPVGWAFTLSAAPGALIGGIGGAIWTEVASGTSTSERASVVFDTLPLAQGMNAIKLTATSPTGEIFSDLSELRIDRFELSEPKDDDVVNLVDPLQVKISRVLDSTVEGLVVEYSVDGGAWRNDGVVTDLPTLSGVITLPVATSPYEIDVRARILSNGSEMALESSNIRVDPALKAGFPVRIQNECGESIFGDYECQSNWVVHPVVADLDADGVKEIVVWRKRMWPQPNELLVIDTRGSIRRTIPLEGHPLERELGYLQFAPRPPLITDLDGDGVPEIVLVQSFIAAWSWWNLNFQAPSVLSVYDATGRVRPGFPLLFEGQNASLVAGDLNRDGQKELVLRNFEVTETSASSVVIVGSDGTIMSKVQLRMEEGRIPVTSLDEGRDSVVGDFDGDDDLEVAAFTTTLSSSYSSSTGFGDETSVFLINWDDFGEKSPIAPAFSGMLFGGGVAAMNSLPGKHNLIFPSMLITGTGVGVHSLSFSSLGVVPSSLSLDPDPESCSWGSGILCGYYATGAVLGDVGSSGANVPLAAVEAPYGAGLQLHLLESTRVGGAISPELTWLSPDSAPIFADISGDGLNDILFFSNMSSIPVFRRGVSALTSESSFGQVRTFATERGFYPSASYPPTATDIDGDGKTDIVAASLSDGYLDRPWVDSFKERFSIYAFGTDGVASSGAQEWYRFRGSEDSNSCLDCSRPALRVVEAPPVITQAPQGQSAEVGGSVQLRVEALGSDLRYQWQTFKLSPEMTDAVGWYDIAGAEGATLMIKAESQGERLYRVRVSHKTRSTMSSEAKVTVTAGRMANRCAEQAVKMFAGVCGCDELDLDEDVDGTFDCIERRMYQSLGRPTVRKGRGEGRYVVTLPRVTNAASYTVRLSNQNARRRGTRSLSRTSRGNRFLFTDMSAGRWSVRWSATLEQVPRLSSVGGDSTSFRVK